ncbi:MAG: PD40 domain-containing protein [Deltaproteobacteria bacterium]|nr:PD40 domain-containing protein [Deltaproteobacteria bacterium]
MIFLLACAPPTPREVFDAEVLPVLERSCAASTCHGVGPDDPPPPDPANTYFQTDGDSHITDPDAAYARALAVANTDESPAYSTLLRKPLSATFGGLPHYGGDNFHSPDDPGYQSVLAWIEMESEGGEVAEPLTPLETLYADTVQPMLAARGCMQGNCHGVSAAIPFRFDPGVDGTFPRQATHDNYAEARTMISMDGDASMSRLLRKGVPMHRGGIVHKGGNTTFFFMDDDPAIEAIEAWACAERAALGGACGDAVEGYFVVVGEVAPADPFVLDPVDSARIAWFSEAEGLVALDLGGEDTRDPAVDPTGRYLAFARREAGESHHHVWMLDRDTGALTQITSGPGTDRDPSFGPDGEVWFVSDREGKLADDGERLDTEIYSVDPGTLEVTRWTWTPHIERKTTFAVHGEEHGGEVLFTALRDAIPGESFAHPFRFPPDLSTEYHQHFGISPVETLTYDMVELPDGRFLAVIGDLGNAWEAGRLAVVDRNFGPEIPSGSEAALPFYADPVSRLDPDAAEMGTTARFYRDPAALPDGRFVAAVAEGPFDLGDGAALPRYRVVRFTVTESSDGSGPVISSAETLVESDVSVYDPVPVYLRQPAPLKERKWDPEADTGTYVHNGLALIDAVLTALPPTGPRPVRDDIVAVRLVEAIAQAPGEVTPLPEWGDRASTTGLGGYAAARILAEFPLAEDGTLYTEVPVGVSFRVQALDAQGFAVGTDHNRWFYVAPGQTLKQGLRKGDGTAYATLCAACHGALDGDPDNVFVEPDVTTTASLTLSRYEDQDPRRPLEPTALGNDTRRTLDYVDDISPLLESCRSCHSATDPAGDLRLDSTPLAEFDEGYVALFERGLLEPGRAGSSTLVTKLGGQAHGELSPHDFATLCTWIDLGAPWEVP